MWRAKSPKLPDRARGRIAERSHLSAGRSINAARSFRFAGQSLLFRAEPRGERNLGPGPSQNRREVVPTLGDHRSAHLHGTPADQHG